MRTTHLTTECREHWFEMTYEGVSRHLLRQSVARWICVRHGYGNHDSNPDKVSGLGGPSVPK